MIGMSFIINSSKVDRAYIYIYIYNHSNFTNLGNSILIKELTKGMSQIGSLLDEVQLAKTLETVGVMSPQVSVLWRTVKHIRHRSWGSRCCIAQVEVTPHQMFNKQFHDRA